jgi:hypothetical protein
MLSKQIVDLSEEHFKQAPAEQLSGEALDKVPADLPSFLADTAPCRHLRYAYIQHLVSATLCRRIFEPFLFSLGARPNKTDGLLLSISQDLRNKSTRKEAVWRQHTLVAAYTSKASKANTNAVAGAVVDEIMRQIKPFADPAKIEIIHAAVRRIVKLAAESWRYARLEREMITAYLAPNAPEGGATTTAGGAGDGAGEWARPACDGLSDVSLAPAQGPCRVLIGLLPTISREPIHESLRTKDEKDDAGCVFCHGVALYSDCLPVRARLHELEPQPAAEAGAMEDGKSSPPPASVQDDAASPAPSPAPAEPAKEDAEDKQAEGGGEDGGDGTDTNGGGSTGASVGAGSQGSENTSSGGGSCSYSGDSGHEDDDDEDDAESPNDASGDGGSTTPQKPQPEQPATSVGRQDRGGRRRRRNSLLPSNGHVPGEWDQSSPDS